MNDAEKYLQYAEACVAEVDQSVHSALFSRTITAGVIGAGTMGRGIAMCFANAGIPVFLVETNQEALSDALKKIEQSYLRSVNKGKMSSQAAKDRLLLIQPTGELSDISHVDVVVEAVFESLEAKQQVFRDLDRICENHTILATNTSYLDVNQIASVTHRPQSVVGLHFFSPAQAMRLLEIVQAKETSSSVMNACQVLAKKLSKIAVIAQVCYGFIGNRMLRHYMREAQRCLLEGAAPWQIDHALESWGMAMGPLAVSDLAGLDISYKARQTQPDSLRSNKKDFCVADELVVQNRLGQKTGAGYYRYRPDKPRERINDPEVIKIIEQQSAIHGIQRRSLTDEEIVERLILALINEGARLLGERIAQSASDIDLVYIHGYGFPRFRGGPMYYADTLTAKVIYEKVAAYQKQLKSKEWTPAPLLKTLALEGGQFIAKRNGQTRSSSR